MTMTTGAAPRDFAELRSLLIQRRDSLPKRLKQLADFAMSQPDEIALGNLVSVGQMVGVPASTLVRFAKALGFEGFPDLQAVFRERLRGYLPDYDERLSRMREQKQARAGALGLLDGLSQASTSSLSRLQANLKEADVERSVSRLAKADTIYVLGQRRAFPLASYAAYLFSRLRLRSVLIDNLGSLGGETMSFASPHDALFALSFTPYTPLTVELTQQAADRKIPIVAITDSVFSPLAGLTEALFEVAEADYQGFRSTAATTALIMTLAILVAERRSG